MSSVNKVAQMYRDQLLSIPQIASALSVPPSRVRTQLLANGIKLRSRQEGIQLRSEHLSNMRSGKKRNFTKSWCENISAAKLEWGEKNARGVSEKPSGYIEYTRGEHKGRSVHVIAMEHRLGRRLLPDECVHHIDGNRANNDTNNLALVTRSGHARLHRREQKITRRMK